MKAGLQRVLALALGVSALAIPASAAATFTDVPSTYWGYSYITEAASKGLVSGIGNNKYGPEDTLSNAQFITMVCNMFYSDQVDSQGSSSQWWRRYMNVAYANGLLNGTTVAGQFSANGDWTTSAVDAEISRYDMAQIIYNLSNAHPAPDQGFQHRPHQLPDGGGGLLRQRVYVWGQQRQLQRLRQLQSGPGGRGAVLPG